MHTRIRLKIGYTWKQLLFSLDVGYGSAVQTIRASVERDSDEFLCNVSRCTAWVSTRLAKIGEAFLVEGESATGIIKSSETAEPSS